MYKAASWGLFESTFNNNGVEPMQVLHYVLTGPSEDINSDSTMN